MTYTWMPKFSKHQRYYSNPLNPIKSIWKSQLFHYSFKDLKRVSTRSMYCPVRMKLHNIRSSRNKRNPVSPISDNKNFEKTWGKFWS